jgi:predicted nucleic acid-binding protein
VAYLDTSALVPMVVTETGTPHVLAWLAAQRGPRTRISNWTRAELVSAISGKVRASVIAAEDAASALAWARAELLPQFALVIVEPADMDDAEALLERFELGLRAGDALHLAIARRLGEPLLTFDRRLAAAAESLGVEVLALD